MKFQKGHKINNGRKPWNKGRKMPELSGTNNPSKRKEVREKISIKLTGRKLSKETKNKLSSIHKENWKNGREKLNSGNWKKGEHTKENNYNWNNGSSYLPYSIEWTNILKTKIRKRDNYTCQICDKNGFNIHHIDYNKKNNNENNLICLCKSCHSKTTYQNRNYWTWQLQIFMNVHHNVNNKIDWSYRQNE